MTELAESVGMIQKCQKQLKLRTVRCCWCQRDDAAVLQESRAFLKENTSGLWF